MGGENLCMVNHRFFVFLFENTFFFGNCSLIAVYLFMFNKIVHLECILQINEHI